MMPRALPLVIVGTLALACNKHDPDPYPGPGTPVLPDTMAVVHFTVNPVWDGAPFDKTVVYNNISDHRVLVQLLKLYLGDIQLDSAGERRTMKDIDLFDITNGPQERFYRMEPGTYDQIHLGVGVPEDLNHTDPVIYPGGHPLSSLNGMFWTWTSAYRFMMFDGRYDTVAGTGVPPYLFSVHTGFDTCYREVHLPGSFTLTAEDTTEFLLDIDLSRFFYSTTDTFKLNETPQWHGEASDLETGLRLSHLVAGSISLQ